MSTTLLLQYDIVLLLRNMFVNFIIPNTFACAPALLTAPWLHEVVPVVDIVYTDMEIYAH